MFAFFEVSMTHRNGNARDLLEKRNTPGETLLVEHGVLRFSGLCHVEFLKTSHMLHTPKIITPHIQHHEEVWRSRAGSLYIYMYLYYIRSVRVGGFPEEQAHACTGC